MSNLRSVSGLATSVLLLVSSSLHSRDYDYKKIVLTAAAGASIVTGIGILYHYLWKPRCHEEEIAYQQEQCAAARHCSSLISFEYEQFFNVLKLEPQDRFNALKALIIAHPGFRPFIAFNIRVGNDRYTMQEHLDLLNACKKETAHRLATLLRENSAIAAHFIPLFVQLEEHVVTAHNELTALINKLEIIERMSVMFTEYENERLQERLEKIEEEIKQLQCKPLPMPVHIHHYHH